MTAEDYIQEAADLENGYNEQLSKLKRMFINANAKFKKGEFIEDLYGDILKIDRIDCVHSSIEDKVHIRYYGYIYKKNDNKLVRTQQEYFMHQKEDKKLVDPKLIDPKFTEA